MGPKQALGSLRAGADNRSRLGSVCSLSHEPAHKFRELIELFRDTGLIKADEHRANPRTLLFAFQGRPEGVEDGIEPKFALVLNRVAIKPSDLSQTRSDRVSLTIRNGKKDHLGFIEMPEVYGWLRGLEAVFKSVCQIAINVSRDRKLDGLAFKLGKV